MESGGSFRKPRPEGGADGSRTLSAAYENLMDLVATDSDSGTLTLIEPR